MATNNTNQLRQDEDRSEEILARIPAGRWGTPADVGGAAIFLASDAAAYVNGYTLAVDGGWLAAKNFIKKFSARCNAGRNFSVYGCCKGPIEYINRKLLHTMQGMREFLSSVGRTQL